jgi:Domain of unknown function (DUF3854)
MRTQNKTARSGAAQHYSDFSQNHTSERWQRVNQRNPCPICTRPTWCRVSPDCAIAGCMREDRGSFSVKQTQLGAMYLHHLGDRIAWSLRLPAPPRSPSSTRSAKRTISTIAAVSVEQRHAVYTALLNSGTLSAEHACYLRDAKRLSEETVARNLYATVTDSWIAESCSSLAVEHDLAGVPGFYDGGKRWRFIGKPGELLIPIRDRHERIVAILRRTGREPKYLFASSSTRGASCGAPSHFALPYLAELYADDPIILTEGTLKADSIAEQLHCMAIGVPGVASLDSFDGQLMDFLRGRRVLIAYDADERRNRHVRDALVRLLRMLTAAGLKPEVLQWDETNGKGLDDVLSGGAQ